MRGTGGNGVPPDHRLQVVLFVRPFCVAGLLPGPLDGLQVGLRRAPQGITLPLVGLDRPHRLGVREGGGGWVMGGGVGDGGGVGPVCVCVCVW